MNTQPGSRKQIGVGGFTISDRAKELAIEVLNSNRLTAGPMMDRFERAIAERHGRKFGLMCNSGTSALLIALAALKERHGWQEGDEVLVPAVSFVATSNVVLFNQLKPVFVDVERDYYNIDPSLIEEKITARTRAIMPVHLGGLPCDMDPIMEITQRHDLRLIEDSAECMFVDYKKRPVGSFGEIACFSTYAAHVISTGVGGLCVTDDPELLALLKSLMNHGRDPVYTRIDDDEEAHDEKLFEIADSRFCFVRLGHSFRASELGAAVGVAQVEEQEANARRRLQVTGRYDKELADLSQHLQLPKVRPECEHGYLFYPLVITNPNIARRDLVYYLENNGIETRYLMPLINQPVYREMFGNLDESYPVATWLNNNAFYIGCHPEMDVSDADFVIDHLHRFFAERT